MMKRSLYITILLLLFLSLFAGCAKDREGAGSDSSDGFSADIKAGFEFVSTRYVTEKMDVDTPYGKSSQEKVFGYGTRWKIVETGGPGLVCEREPRWFTVQSSGGEVHKAVDFDSRRDDFSELPGEYMVFYLDLGEISVITIGSEGRVADIRDLDSMAQRMKDKGESLYGADIYTKYPGAAYSMEAWYGEYAVKQRLELELSSMVPVDAKKGSSWEKELTQYGNIQMTLIYTFEGEDEKYQKVGFRQKVTLNSEATQLADHSPSSEGKEFLNSVSYTKAEGDGRGELWIVPGSGFVHHGHIVQNLSYEMEVPNVQTEEMDEYSYRYEIVTEYSAD